MAPTFLFMSELPVLLQRLPVADEGQRRHIAAVCTHGAHDGKDSYSDEQKATNDKDAQEAANNRGQEQHEHLVEVLVDERVAAVGLAGNDDDANQAQPIHGRSEGIHGVALGSNRLLVRLLVLLLRLLILLLGLLVLLGRIRGALGLSGGCHVGAAVGAKRSAVGYV